MHGQDTAWDERMDGKGEGLAGDTVYVLYGYRNTLEENDAMIVMVSTGAGAVREALHGIMEDRASAYIELHGEIQEERGEGCYEVMDASGRYARFYITRAIVERMTG